MANTASDVIRRHHDVEFSWAQAVSGAGVPQRIEASPGIYTVYAGQELLYIGKSRNLMRRIGQFIGAACGGWGLHSGGWHLFEERRPELPMDSLRFEVFIGEDAYTKEKALLKRCKTSLNRQGTALKLKPFTHFVEDAELDTLLDPMQDEESRLSACGRVLDALAKSVNRTPHGTASPWKQAGFIGDGRRFGLQWKYTVYLGFEAAGPAVGIWAYTDNDPPWFGATVGEVAPREDEEPVTNRSDFIKLTESFRDRWFGLGD